MIKIVEERTQYHRFALYFEPFDPKVVELCRMLKESFGIQQFSYNLEGGNKKWVFSQSIIVRTFQEQFPDVEVEPAVEAIVLHELKWKSAEVGRLQRIDALKKKTETDFHIKGLKGAPYPYQLIGVEFLLESGGKAIIADSPGLGKTLQFLAYAKHKGFTRSLVVCPATVKSSWEGEIKKWTNLSAYVIEPKTKLHEIPADINFWIINYDVLKKFLPELAKIRFDAVCGDEAHMVKSNTAQRTKAFRALSRFIPNIILLTGTPLLSRPIELYSLLNIIDPSKWNNFYDYARKYCGAVQTRWGLDVSGATNTEELHKTIRKYFLRRTKDEVLKELPPKNYIDVPVTMERDLEKRYNMAEQNLAKYMREHAGKQPKEIMKAHAAEKLVQLNYLRQIVAESKVETTKELVESLLESGDKVLIFSAWNAPLDKLKEYFGSAAVKITGKTPVEDRGLIVKQFQEDSGVKIFLGGYKSAGQGITLTAASHVIFNDMSWNPADHQQSQDRAHRIGAKYESLNIYQLAVKNTIDDDLRDMLIHKQEVFDTVIEGKTIESVTNKALDSVARRVAKKL